MSKTGPSLADLAAVPGSMATAREIAQQPETWREVLSNVEAQRKDVDSFLSGLLARPDLRIVLTGAGTSAFIGSIAAPALSRLLNRRVDAISTTDLVSNPHEYLTEDVPTLLVSFARSGNSPESTAATRLADQCLTQVSHLVITCDEEGSLFKEHEGRQESKIVLMPKQANDEGFAMTSSFTSMLLSCLLIFHPVSGAAVGALADAANGLLATRQESLRVLAGRGYERVVYLGSGPLTGLARESALKLLELTAGKVVALHDSALGFRHGPKAVLDDRTLVVVYVSSDSYTRRYDLDILDELCSTMDPGNVIAIAPAPLPLSRAETWVLPDVDGLNDAFLAVGYVVIAQLLGLSFALQVGTTPDNPFPGGDVNRVVKGVRIHPLPQSKDSDPFPEKP
jgi:tagatose-6-phosphate ketose/aldose isomerase